MRQTIDCSRLDLESYDRFLRAKLEPFYEVKGRSVVVEDSRIDIDLLKTLEANESHLWSYQRFIVGLAVQRQRYAIYAECGAGKTPMGLAWLRRVLPTLGDKKAIIVAPLGVIPQWIEEERKFYGESTIVDIHNLDMEEWVMSGEGRIGITNHDKFHEKRDFAGRVGAVVIDEASILKNGTGKTRIALTDSFKGVPWKLCLTATPAPNDREEYASQAVFLEYVRSANEFYARFFVNRDNGWEIKPHGLEAFYRYLASWSVYCREPHRYGFDSPIGNLPKPVFSVVDVPWTDEQTKLLGASQRTIDGEVVAMDAMVKRQHFLQLSKGFLKTENGIQYVASNKPQMVLDIIRKEAKPTIVWVMFNEEERILRDTIRGGGLRVVALSGATSEEERTQIVADFRAGKYDVVISKPRLMGFGLNLPFVTCQIFSGITDSFEQLHQCVRRSYRYGATESVHVYFPITNAERTILENVMSKKETFEEDSRKQEDSFIKSLEGEVDSFFGRPYARKVEEEDEGESIVKGEHFTTYRGDAIKLLRNEVEPESIDFSVFSPPFASLFTYSDDIADMGNSGDGDGEFRLHLDFFLQGLYRAMKSGRMVCCHVQQLATLKYRDGFVGTKDFRGAVIDHFQQAGFHYFGEWCIWKNPQAAAMKDKVRSLAFAQLGSDRLGSRPGFNDYLLIFKKPGEASVRVNSDDGPNREEWIKWAAGVWTDINASDTLNVRGTKEDDDVKHLCVARDSLVLTDSGFKKIQDIEIGESVLTHMGRWRKVTAKAHTGRKRIVKIKAQGVPGLRVTPDHKVWARSSHGKSHWLSASEATPDWVRSDEIVNSFVNLKLPPEKDSEYTEHDWWVIGRWIGDGHFDSRGRAHISCNRNEIDGLRKRLGQYAGASFDTGTCEQIALYDDGGRLRSMLSKCGDSCYTKKIPIEGLCLPANKAAALLDGYLSADGHLVPGRERTTASSVSRELLLGVAMLAQRARGIVASVYAGRGPRTSTIQGRTVSCNQDWIFAMSKIDRWGKILEDGAWKKVRSVKDDGEEDVWDITVEEDASFTVEGMIVKNCPLQLPVIERAIRMYTNPGELVLSPFMGIGSEGFVSLQTGRRFVGLELKGAYFREAVANLKKADRAFGGFDAETRRAVLKTDKNTVRLPTGEF